MKLIADLKKYREILIDLAKRDVKNKYLGSYLGFFWAFLQPLFSLVILWGVFSFGLKIKTDSKVSFFLWLMTGLIPWNFLSEGIVSSANSILENSFLVKKIVFRISLLPIVKVLSSSLVHCFFIFILFLSFLASGYELDIYCLQVFYYFFCGTTFIFVLSWISSSVIIFFKDIGQIISLSLQFLYWLTPILWSYTVLPEKFKIFLITASLGTFCD